jgi:hypothetical protein
LPHHSNCHHHSRSKGPEVGIYPCDGGSNQQWTTGSNYIESVGLNGQCLAQSSFNSGGSAAQIVVNEFGNGELTFYGADVIDVCIGVCVL